MERSPDCRDARGLFTPQSYGEFNDSNMTHNHDRLHIDSDLMKEKSCQKAAQLDWFSLQWVAFYWF